MVVDGMCSCADGGSGRNRTCEAERSVSMVIGRESTYNVLALLTRWLMLASDTFAL
jgi:hypothetical protein